MFNMVQEYHCHDTPEPRYEQISVKLTAPTSSVARLGREKG